jgi:hypothetical protein
MMGIQKDKQRRCFCSFMDSFQWRGVTPMGSETFGRKTSIGWSVPERSSRANLGRLTTGVALGVQSPSYPDLAIAQSRIWARSR